MRVEVWTDGSSSKKKSHRERLGWAWWIDEDNNGFGACHVTSGKATTAISFSHEKLAACHAVLEASARGATWVHVVTDCESLMLAISGKNAKLSAEWSLYLKLFFAERDMDVPDVVITVTRLPGHSGIVQNCWCDRNARRASQELTPIRGNDPVPTRIAA